MTPYFSDSNLTLYVGSCLDVLRKLPDESVQCCVTSPPYWGLRDYGVKGQIGLEKSFADYISTMSVVFLEVWRVLKTDGTCWVNLGDSYVSSECGIKEGGVSKLSGLNGAHSSTYRNSLESGHGHAIDKTKSGLRPKNLVGIPWRVAFALQESGWYLRSDIIWHKPNPMPESVTDRPTKAHEYIFLLSKSERYYYDADAIRELVTGNAHSRGNGLNPKAMWKTPDGWDTSKGEGGHGAFHKNGREKGKKPGKNSRIHVDRDPAHCRPKPTRQNDSFSAAVAGLVDDRNKRTVWTVATSPYKEAHFATYPPDLIKPCILAGSRVCDVVLDPFFGAGTTGLVAIELGRKCVGIELNPDYAEMAIRRCNVTPGLPI